ncbi:XrtA-associated tyrosine autokinase [Caenispirillum bisanense]|uniref:non-specific protein-tyrosine kinase n=1 Tax=Caenispirillum bisanense TaxID=414052 RepID=A0A286G7C0_9PROT|nr:XrtA-associated tyrosine autokinase [Caenispirillum bisanense]SOD90874.1 receptor protein-tyrosine kinase [Caenispirillum bisanense]
MTSVIDTTASGHDDPRKARRVSLVERAAQRLGGDAPQPELAGAGAAVAERPAPAAPPPPQQQHPHPHHHSPRPAPRPSPAADAVSHGGPAGGGRVDIDLDRLQAGGMVTPRGERSSIAEEFRMIKRPLLQAAFTYRPGQVRKENLIMVTSALPSEGKSFTAVNLAMSIAKERDVHVLLVDADLSRPNVGAMLGISAERGLTDLLEDPSLSVPDVLMRTNVPNLSIILAGKPHPMGTELLASQRATAIIREMAERYKDRVIIFDSAPTLVSAEGTALSPHVGQVLLIVEAERTTELEVKGALDVLHACENVQLVLNKVRTRFGVHSKGVYDGYYYYG